MTALPPSVIQARDSAMAQVERNAGVSFGNRAREFVLKYLKEHGETSGEKLTDECKRAGIIPHDDRAFGSVFGRLSHRDGRIEFHAYCLRRKGHGTGGGTVWRATNLGMSA